MDVVYQLSGHRQGFAAVASVLITCDEAWTLTIRFYPQPAPCQIESFALSRQQPPLVRIPHSSTLPTMRFLFLTSALLLCWAGACLGLTVHDLGNHGKTYPIVEQDMAELVRERASKLHQAALKDRLRGKTGRFELPRELRVELPEGCMDKR